ncbi:MAG: pantoate--beta-alanine ligase [Acidimicrobiales bacterium]
MEHISDLVTWRSYANQQRASGRGVALVPTMGALHEGHAALFRAAKASGDVVIATLFVNPRQFDNGGDLISYPRTPEDDALIAKENGVDCLVAPTLQAMWPDYPGATATTVSVHGVGDLFEGAARPGHFDGVASVVAKLLILTGPCRAYFGEKDFQQLAVVRQMVSDLALEVEVVGCPIVRDPDGLAVSSRNRYLSPDARRRALSLSRALAGVAGPGSASQLRRRLREVLDGAGVETSYAEIVDPVTFATCSDDEDGVRRALVAAVVDGVRLIDNAPVTLLARGS